MDRTCAVLVAAIASFSATASAAPSKLKKGPTRPQAAIEIKELHIKAVVKPDQALSKNLDAAATIYQAAMLEELRMFAVVDRIAALFQRGELPLRGSIRRQIPEWIRVADRLTDAERRTLYGHVLGGDVPAESDVVPNRDFDALFARFLAAAGAFERETSGHPKKAKSVSAKAVYNAARSLALNLSNRSYGAPVEAAGSLARKIELAEAILSDAQVRKAYGAKDAWEVVERVAEEELGKTVDATRARSSAEEGAAVIAWLGTVANPLSSKGGVDKVAAALVRSKVPASVRKLDRSVGPKHKLQPVSKGHAKVVALCFDDEHELVRCTARE